MNGMNEINCPYHNDVSPPSVAAVSHQDSVATAPEVRLSNIGHSAQLGVRRPKL